MAGLSHLIDTDLMVEIMRGRSPEVRRRLDEHEGSVAVSSISVAELTYGALRSSSPEMNRAAVEQLLDQLPVLAFDERAAHEAAAVRVELAGRGQPIGPYDVLIAGQARSMGLVVASVNVREFRRVRGLDVENWRRV